MPLGKSFWVDETLTYWNVMHGIAEVIPRSSLCTGQFQLYMLITAMSAKIFGLNELGIRLPSIVAALCSSLLMFILGKRYSDTETGIIAAVLFVCMPVICLNASNARPYSLVVLCSLWALWQLTRFHDTGKWRHLVGYVIAATLMVYMHYISSPFLIVLMLYSALLLKNDNSSKYKTLLAHISIIVALLPLAYLIIISNKDTALLSFVPTPSLYNYVGMILTDYVMFVIVIILLCKMSLRIKISDLYSIHDNCILFVLLWLIIPITSLYLISVFTEYKIFVQRYFITSYPALVLILASAIRKIERDMFRYVALISSCIVGTLLIGEINIKILEDWRGALTKVNELAGPMQIPMLFNSGMVETNQPGWELQNADHHLLSPLSAYPTNTQIIALPANVTEKSLHYLETYVTEKIRSAKSFLVVLRTDNKDRSIEQWTNGYALSHGFKRTNIDSFHGIIIILYQQLELNL